ncbi:MAG: sulfatase-like hydrolase/transferase [Solobacterium sp.]|nr:sulfatase-like hydrolase/transferase [Solobacterium sp.]
MTERRPNILLLVSDQHRGDWMPYDGETKKKQGTEDLHLNMPEIRGLMDRGTAFTCAVSPSPVCAPARACLASGRRYRNCRVYQNNINYDTALPTFYGMLSADGYYVSGVGKFDLNKGDLTWGEDGFHEALQRMGFSDAKDSEGKMDAVWASMMGQPGPYGKVLEKAGFLKAYSEDMMSRGHGTDPAPVPPELYADNWIGARACRMIAEAPKDKPWFIQVNFSGPHDPWDVTEEMRNAVKNREMPVAADCTGQTQNQDIRRNYAAMIENIDRLIGECLKTLDETGERDHTLVIYTADHGEMMGDHDMYGKSKPEQGSIMIPMVVDASCFGSAGGRVNNTPVELQDLAATCLDYAGVKPSAKLESVSLRPVVEGKEEKVRSYAISELLLKDKKNPFDAFAAITDGEWKLIMKNRLPDRLYHIAEDPFEMNDLAESHPEIVERLRQDFADRGQKPNPMIEAYKKSFRVEKERN